MKSDQIDELAKALSKAQSEIKHASRDAENPFFKSHYSTLSSVWDACREPLTKNGLSVVQTVDCVENRVCLVTILLHESGQFISGSIPLPMIKPDVQALGSEITYCRRYALAAIIGIASQDDDGNEAVKPPETPRAAIKNHAPTTTTPVHVKPSIQGHNATMGGYEMPFGMHKGLKLADIPDLLGWVKYMRSTESPGNELKSRALEAVENAEAYLGVSVTQKGKIDINEPAFDELNPPPFDDEQIPF